MLDAPRKSITIFLESDHIRLDLRGTASIAVRANRRLARPMRGTRRWSRIGGAGCPGPMKEIRYDQRYRSEEGASLDELTTATGWQPHSCRAFLTGLRKKGWAIERQKREDGTTIWVGVAPVAYATSERHEGWKVISERYDDGGFSGGNMERPSLKSLLADVARERSMSFCSTRSTD